MLSSKDIAREILRRADDKGFLKSAPLVKKCGMNM